MISKSWSVIRTVGTRTIAGGVWLHSPSATERRKPAEPLLSTHPILRTKYFQTTIRVSASASRLLALVCALLVSHASAQVPSFTGAWTSRPLALTPAGLPDGRGWVDMIYDPVARMPVLFGGSGGLGYMNDIEAIDFGSGRWLEVEPYVPQPTPYGPPCGRDEYAFEFDAFNSLYWIFGGSLGCKTTVGVVAAGSTSSTIVDLSLPATAADYYNDWQVSISAAPTNHYSSVTAYDAVTKTLTLATPFPGNPAGRSYALRAQNGGGTWYYNPATRQWRSFEGPFGYSGDKPESRLSPAFSYSTVDHVLVMFGGMARNDTWALDVETKSWLMLRDNGWANQPSRRAQITNAMVYDSANNVFVLFGGQCNDNACGNSGYLADTWIYSIATNTWTPMAPIVSPPARKQHTLSFDTQNGVVVLVGGTDGVTIFDDVWIYHVPSNTWRQVSTGAGSGARRIHSTVYDPSIGEHVVYGGVGITGSLNDVWTLRLTRGADLAASTTRVTSSTNPLALGASVMLTATVTGSGPTGSVSFLDDGVAIVGCEALNLTGSGNSRTADCSTSSLVAGSHSINATYGGDSVNLASNSASVPLVQIVAAPGISNGGFESPNLAGWYMASPPDAIWSFGSSAGIAGNSNAFTSGNGPAPEGTQVAFLQGDGTAIQVGNFAAGQYTLSLRGAQRGNFQFGTQIVQVAIDGAVVGLFQPPSAIYTTYVTPQFTIANAGFHTLTLAGVGSGTDYTAFVDAVVLNNVAPPVVATLGSSANPAIFGSRIAFTATVTGSNPSGDVAFADGGNSISGCAAVTLTGSGNTKTATCTTSTFAVGNHNVVASYAGDANNAAVSSPPLTQVVNALASTTKLTSSANPASFGSSVTLTATVSGSNPTGSVTFTDGGSSISGCAAVVLTGSGNSKTATCTTSSLAVGNHSIVASYSGDAGNIGFQQPPLSLVVTRAAPRWSMADSNRRP